MKVGLLAAPGLPYALAKKVARSLPELLVARLDEQRSWDVSVVNDPLTGSEMGMPDFLEACIEYSKQEGWDLVIYLTDLPVRTKEYIVVADVSKKHGAAGLSVPALGAVRLHRKVRETILWLAGELYAEPQRSTCGQRRGEGKEEEKDGSRTTPYSRRLPAGRLAGWVAPIHQVAAAGDTIDVRFVSPAKRGYLWLLPGMVRVNRPWSLLPNLEHVIAAAFATGAFGLIFPSVWKLGDVSGGERLVAATVLAIAAMVFWLIVSHDLWERTPHQSDDGTGESLVGLYNTVTVLTLSTSVLLFYMMVFGLLLLAAVILIPATHLESVLGHPVSMDEYVVLTWLATSIATVGGALGAGLEDDEEVREVAFGYRQSRRLEQAQQASDSSGED